MPPGLRERKKRRTREAIVREAIRLFAERGFDAVTVADIADAADIAPRTFFAYFPSKEEVVFADMPEALDELARRLATREADATTLDTLQAWIVDVIADIDPTDHEERCRRDIVRETPSLAARHAAKLSEFEALLRDGVATDLGEPADGLRARLVAAAAVAALVALEDAGDRDGAESAPSPEEILAEAIAFLRGGIEALRERAAPPAV